MDGNKLDSGVEKTVSRWLEDDGWSVKKKDYEDAAWAVVAEDGAKRKIIVGQKLDKQDELILQARVKFDNETRGKLDSLKEGERNNFLWEMRFELLRARLDFSGVKYPLKAIEVVAKISSEALVLTKDSFRRGLSDVRFGILIIQWMLMRKLEEHPPERKIGFIK